MGGVRSGGALTRGGGAVAPGGRPGPLLVLLSVPLSAAGAALIVSAAVWPRLPQVMVTHWGAGGADGWMPRGWAVGIPLAMSLGCAGWALWQAARHRRSPAVAVDTTIVCGLFAWMGTMTLISSIWFTGNGGLVVTLVAVVPVLAAVLMWRYAGRSGLRGRR